MTTTPVPPPGLEALIPAFNRATRLAKALFGAFESLIALSVGQGEIWRSRGAAGVSTRDPWASVVLETGKAVWIDDLLLDPDKADSHPVKGPLGLRFWAAAPIRLADGSFGAIVVVGRQPRPFDEKLMARLCDIADTVAHECDRERAIRAETQSAADAQTAMNILGAFVETVPVGIVMTDREMRVLQASPSWLKFMGQTADQAVGKSVYEIEPGMLKYKPIHDRVLLGERVRNPRLRVAKPDRAPIWLETDSRPWLDPTGKVGGILVCTHDVTDVINALDRTERSEQRLKMAVELADLHVWEMDYARGVLEKVGAADTFFDKPITYEDVLKDPLCGIHPEDRAMAAASLARRMAGSGEEPLFCRVNRSDGKEVWAASAAEIITGADGKRERIVGLFQNVTSVKLAERALIEARDAAEAANRAKSEFLANMSHEIRTPLNGVLGMAQVIEQDELSDVQRERIKVVRESGAALLAILNDVLDLSKIQAGKLELSLADFDMSELAPVIGAAFEGSAAAKDLALTVEVDESASGAWIGDVLRLRQVLSNLVSNSLKFTNQGAVTLSVRHDGQAMVFAVRDTGIGIETGKIAQLFDKFSQEDASTTRRYGGTGLGLAISRELVELMDGEIAVESRKGKGSCFTVTLPLKRGEARRTPAKPVERPEAQDSLGEIRILAAEDNPTNQLVLRSLLQPLGVELTLASNGRLAVEAFAKGQFDIVLMDVQMPEMNGVEATQAIRAMETKEGRDRTPILALSANVMTHQVADYLACGMDSCIAKPIEVEKLYAALAEALDSPAANRAA